MLLIYCIKNRENESGEGVRKIRNILRYDTV